MCQSFTNDGVMQERDKQLICLLITAKYNLIKKNQTNLVWYYLKVVHHFWMSQR